MIAIDAPDPDDNKRKPQPPKMVPPKPDKDPDGRNRFEELLKKLKPQLDEIPEELRIPALPPNEDSAEEVQKYVQNTMGLYPASEVPNWVLIGNESLERSKIREGRLGLSKGCPVFAFLYPYEGKRFKTVFIYPRDGNDPRMIAKAILWGIVGEIPGSHAQSEIKDVDSFFALQCLDSSKLYDAPALERAKTKYREEIQLELESVKTRLQQTEVALTSGQQSLSNSAEREKSIRQECVNQHNRAEVWKVAAFGAICLIPTAILIAKWLGI